MINVIIECLHKAQDKLQIRNGYEVHIPEHEYDRLVDHIFDDHLIKTTQVVDPKKSQFLIAGANIIRTQNQNYCYIIASRRVGNIVERKVGCIFTLDGGEV